MVEPGDPAGVNGGPCISGTADCPCCGLPTMVEDWRVPELCDECVAAGCDTDGSDPLHDDD